MRLIRNALVVTLLIGLLSVAAVTAGLPREQRTLSMISAPVQSLMSVTAPLAGIILVSPAHRKGREMRLIRPMLAAVLFAAVVATFGALVCIVALAVTPSEAPQGRWDHLGSIVLGGLLVQVVAQLVGTGLGLLITRRTVAFVASIVLPLGAWAALGAIDALRPAQAFTPFGLVSLLLTGQMTSVLWGSWLVMVLIWCVGLNCAGVIRQRRQHSTR